MPVTPSRVLHENAVLLAASRVDDGPMPALDTPGFDWEYVLRAAEVQGVTQLLYQWRQARGVSFPDAVVQTLHHAYWMNHFRNRLLLDELERLGAAAHASGARLMPLKGASVATAYYPAVGWRPLADLDLMVRHEDVGPLVAVLRELGYAPFDPEPAYAEERCLDPEAREQCWFVARPGVDVIVEFRVQSLELAAGRLAELDSGLTAILHRYTAGVWERALQGQTARGWRVAIPPEDVLLLTAAHFAAKHIDFRLIWLRDLAQIIQAEAGFDWDYLLTAASRLRVNVPLAAALTGAVRWVGAAVPDAVLQRLGSSSPRSRLARYERHRLAAYVAAIGGRDLTSQGPSVWALLTALARVRGFARLRAVRWVLFPSPGYRRHRSQRRRGGLTMGPDGGARRGSAPRGA